MRRSLRDSLSIVAALLLISSWELALADDETLPADPDGRIPQSIEEIWADFDPRAESLETEILHEWADGDVICRIVRFRVGVFRGEKSWMGGLYAFPRGGSQLPALMQLHGGGQSANSNAAISNARRGYACLSLNWGGNPLYDAEYHELWESAVTDWGRVDATHPPRRDPLNHFAQLTPNEFTLDDVESPRNSAWVLVVTGARRGLTFLEQQPEVDAARLGVYGHSMGGKLTVMTAALDPRVVAAVPSCGGISDYPTEQFLENSKFCARLTCPVLFLNPVNDFYGRSEDLNAAAAALLPEDARFSCVANLDHRDIPEHFVCGPLWFDQHLQGTFQMPQTPGASLELSTQDDIPRLHVTPDSSQPVLSVDVYYTQAAKSREVPNPCWRYVSAEQDPLGWSAALPLMATDGPLRAYANVRYALAEPVSGAGYYYGSYTATEFVLSSAIQSASTEELQTANVRATDMPSLVIEDFPDGWQRGWYTYSEQGEWPYRTNKVQDPKWHASPGARLELVVQSAQPSTLVLEVDQHAIVRELPGGDEWQTVTVRCNDLIDAEGIPLADWANIQELMIGSQTVLRRNDLMQPLGAPWQGEPPRFRELRWSLDQ